MTIAPTASTTPKPQWFGTSARRHVEGGVVADEAAETLRGVVELAGG